MWPVHDLTNDPNELANHKQSRLGGVGFANLEKNCISAYTPHYTTDNINKYTAWPIKLQG